jgi:hypothetical protein
MQTVSAATYLASYARPMAGPQPHQPKGAMQAMKPVPLPSGSKPLKPLPLPSAKALSRGDALAPLATVAAQAMPAAATSATSETTGQAQHQEACDPPMTLEGLIEAWGTSHPQYDLNGDGTVDVLDLLAFLDSFWPAE